MAVIVVAQPSTHTVVVARTGAVSAVRTQTNAVQVGTPAPSAAAVTERSTVVQVGSVGVQGRDGAPGGTFDSYEAGETLGGHRLVRSRGDGTVGYASSADPAHGNDTVGMTLGAASAGATVNVQRTGPVEFNGWTWLPGELVFLGLDGLPTQTAPSSGVLQPIGHADTPTRLILAIGEATYFED